MKARDCLLLDFLVQTSDVIIVVVDKFTALEKCIVDKFRSTLISQKNLQKLVIVHNYFDRDKYSELLFSAKIDKENFRELYQLNQYVSDAFKYYLGIVAQKQVMHFVIPNLFEQYFSQDSKQKFILRCNDFIQKVALARANFIQNLLSHVSSNLYKYVQGMITPQKIPVSIAAAQQPIITLS